MEEKKEDGMGTLKKDRTLLRDERKMEKLKAKLHTDDDCELNCGVDVLVLGNIPVGCFNCLLGNVFHPSMKLGLVCFYCLPVHPYLINCIKRLLLPVVSSASELAGSQQDLQRAGGGRERDPPPQAQVLLLRPERGLQRSSPAQSALCAGVTRASVHKG